MRIKARILRTARRAARRPVCASAPGPLDGQRATSTHDRGLLIMGNTPQSGTSILDTGVGKFRFRSI